MSKGRIRAPTKKTRPPRPPLPPAVKDEVLRKCRRHCCICYGLRGLLEVKDGQIAHLDGDRANNDVDNLAYLCLECHKIYDTKNNRVQSYTPGEARHYRALLFRALKRDQIEWTLTLRGDRGQYTILKEAVDEAHAILRGSGGDVSLNESPVE